MKLPVSEGTHNFSKETIIDLLLICRSVLKSGCNAVSFDIPLRNGEIYKRVHINMTFEVFK